MVTQEEHDALVGEFNKATARIDALKSALDAAKAASVLDAKRIRDEVRADLVNAERMTKAAIATAAEAEGRAIKAEKEAREALARLAETEQARGRAVADLDQERREHAATRARLAQIQAIATA